MKHARSLLGIPLLGFFIACTGKPVATDVATTTDDRKEAAAGTELDEYYRTHSMGGDEESAALWRKIEGPRAPAAAWDEGNAENTFNAILSDAQPSERFLRFLERSAIIYYYTKHAVEEYDKALDKEYEGAKRPGQMMKSMEYARALCVWEESHRIRDKFIWLYRLAIETALDSAGDKGRQEKAKTLLRDLRRALDTTDIADRLTLSVFALQGEEMRRDMEVKYRERAYVSSADVQEFLDRAFWSNIIFDDIHQVIAQNQSVLEQKKSRYKNMQNNLTLFNPCAKAVQERINQMYSQEANGQREPSAVAAPPHRIEPSPEKYGNVTGSWFPQGTWAMTYDDGPGKKTTPTIFENLTKQNTKATFFWLTQNAKLMNSIVLQGRDQHAVACHSYSHANIPKLDAAGQEHEITEATTDLNKILTENGAKPANTLKYFRLPYGSGLNVTGVRERIAKNGLIHVFWNIDTLDWQDKNPDVVFERTRKQMEIEKRGIILFHDIHPQSVIASNRIIEMVNSQKASNPNLRWVTIPEAVDEYNAKIK